MSTLGCNVTVFDLPASVQALKNIFKILDAPSILCLCGDDKDEFNKVPPDFTLVSEHAWSECPRAVRTAYGNLLFKNAAAGWLTCNGVMEDHASPDEVQDLVTPGISVLHSDVFSSDRSWAISWTRT